MYKGITYEIKKGLVANCYDCGQKSRQMYSTQDLTISVLSSGWTQGTIDDKTVFICKDCSPKLDEI